MALSTHGISLLNLHREAGMTISRPRGQFDSILQPYAVDTSRIAQVLSQVLTIESSHPLFPNMLLATVDLDEDVAGITRIRANYLGLMSGTGKAPVRTQRTGDVKVLFISGNSGLVPYAGDAKIYVTENSVESVEPDIDELFAPPKIEVIGWTLIRIEWDKRLTSIDWRSIGNLYEVTRQYEFVKAVEQPS